MFGHMLSKVAAGDLLQRVERRRDDVVAAAPADAGEDVPGHLRTLVIADAKQLTLAEEFERARR
jgi:hypothetical protein